MMPTNPATDRPVDSAELPRIMQAMQILSERRGERVTRVSAAELRDLMDEGLIPPPSAPNTPSKPDNSH